MEQPSFTLTWRDRDMLETLTLRVRVMSVEQVGRRWFSNSNEPTPLAVRRLRILERAGLVHLGTRASRPTPEFHSPLAIWNPGEAPPDFAEIARRTFARWRERAVSIHLAVATRRAGTYFGGEGGRWPRESETSHDLALASVYLRHFSPNQETARTWQSEARLRGKGFGDDMRLPDARCVRDGRHVFIELLGEYRHEKLRDFHEFCMEQETGYEFW